jgi:hypothetical protein
MHDGSRVSRCFFDITMVQHAMIPKSRSFFLSRIHKGSQFTYLALDGNEIWLLNLYPGAASKEPGCELIRKPLITSTSGEQDETAYEALSYTWGSAKDKVQLSYNQGSLAVIRNPHTALTHLRHRDTTRRLWVDAVCINQADMSERAAQVSAYG